MEFPHRRHTKCRSVAITESEKVEASNRDGLGLSRRQSIKRKISLCFNDGQSPAPCSRSLSLRRHKRGDSEDSEVSMEDKPRYVHTPQHAGSSHLSSTSPVPFSSRVLPRNTYIEPVLTSAQRAAEMRRLGQARAEHGGRPILVGSV